MARKKPLYKRVLVKISGEMLGGQGGFGLEPSHCQELAASLKALQDAKVEVGVVVGGGNIFRGSQSQGLGIARDVGDHAGMFATIINGLILQQALESLGCKVRLLSALGATEIIKPYEWHRALHYLSEGTIVIFVGGTGNPYFTTDTCASLRAAQVQAEVLLKATKVDGVYDKDPAHYTDAKRFDRLTYEEALHLGLKVMDATAISMCRENRIPIRVFSLATLSEAIVDPNVGTLVEA